MLNFSNLNDIEFEYLCKDVMSRMLGLTLQRFGRGRDGGIDLTDDVYKRTVIVQVKHYIKTDVSGLIAALRNEVSKVKDNNPAKYYVCCSKELTPQNKRDIYDLFSDYMESTNNIISITEINDFLEEECNIDILRKHFKLWIESTNILTDVFCNDICIDSEVLLSDINDLAHLFVKTQAYDKALECLDKNNVLIIIGNPGVGKTITSKMLVLNYASQGYKIRHTTDGSDLAALKKALKKSKEKEIILLDDCFGQAYFNMKETQEDELLSLIKHVKMSSNKILIMNSRVTIYQEATLRTPSLVRSFDRKEYKAYILDMSNVSSIEKAKIFYNHLYFGGIPKEYREDIKKNKNYIKIVRHDNYNPRIVEFVTSKRQFEQIPPKGYAEFILSCLNNPEEIWENEYSRRLKNVDRILLNTLYSLTNSTVSIDVIKRCFEYRLSKTQGVDLSINHFEQSLKRLQNSMIKIVDSRGQRMISTINPSVNDFLRAHLSRNTPEKDQIIKCSKCFLQLARLLTEEEYEEKLRRLFKDETILEYVFESDKQKREFIASFCTENGVLNMAYKHYLEEYILSPNDLFNYKGKYISFSDMYKKMIKNGLYLFYQINKIICDISNLKEILSNLSLKGQIEFISQVDGIFEGQARDDYIEVVEEIINETIDMMCSTASVEEWYIDVSEIVDCYRYDKDEAGHIDVDAVIDEVDRTVEDYVLADIIDSLSQLPEGLCNTEEIIKGITIYVSGSSSLVESYLADEYADYSYEDFKEREHESLEIEYIFER